MIKNVTIGADPELFVEKNGEIISVEGLIGGTKEKPIPISKEGHAIQEDNVMVEYNIPACKTTEEFIDALNFVENYIEIKLKLQGCNLKYVASAELNKKWLKTSQATRFGCDPDFNVYLENINPSPDAKGVLRTAGGHIHVGYDTPTQLDSEKIIFAMDMLLGLPSVILDKDNRRKEMYGSAGSFRFKKYGVEYRTLSNFWLETDELKKWAFTQTMKAVDLANMPDFEEIVSNFRGEIEQTINSNNNLSAKKLIKEINKEINKKKKKHEHVYIN